MNSLMIDIAPARLDLGGSESSSRTLLIAQNWIFGTGAPGRPLSQETSAITRRHLRQADGANCRRESAGVSRLRWARQMRQCGCCRFTAFRAIRANIVRA